MRCPKVHPGCRNETNLSFPVEAINTFVLFELRGMGTNLAQMLLGGLGPYFAPYTPGVMRNHTGHCRENKRVSRHINWVHAAHQAWSDKCERSKNVSGPLTWMKHCMRGSRADFWAGGRYQAPAGQGFAGVLVAGVSEVELCVGLVGFALSATFFSRSAALFSRSASASASVTY